MNYKALKTVSRRAAAAVLSLAMATAAFAAADVNPAEVIKVESKSVEKADRSLVLRATLDVAALKNLHRDREVWLTPVLRGENKTDSLEFDPVCVAGHNRYYILRRGITDEAGLTAIRRASRTEKVSVEEVAEFQPWMELAVFTFRTELCGCCDKPVALADIPVDSIDLVPRVFEPVWAYITPPAEVKTRALSGSAYIDFPVNRTELYPEYRRNPEELAAILKTIDKVRGDADVTIDTITITGYASPEGPWDNNVRLAKGRTATLIAHIRDLYAFPADLLRQSYVPEDWAGLIRYLRSTDLVNRDAIIAVASDESIAPDARDAKLKRDFPVQYAWIYKEIYPALRHSDYTIKYTVVDYTDPAKIAEVMKTDPSKLSVGELFTLANTLDPDSEEYREVFETAVLIDPANPIANLNAANTALRHHNFRSAEFYLAKAGNSPEAEYVRGLLYAMQGDYAKAYGYFTAASKAGFAKADDAINQMRDKRFIK